MNEEKPKHLIFSLDDPRTLKLLRQVLEESADGENLLQHRLSSDTAARHSSGVARSELIAAAKCVYRYRRQRLQLFPAGMFGEPAWDMLIAMYSLSDTIAAVSVGRLCAFSGAPPTTALRWMDYLTAQGFLERTEAINDKRKAMISITAKAEGALDHYFEQVLSDWDGADVCVVSSIWDKASSASRPQPDPKPQR
jgi:DNA-binding MarR family transcriptional regulator